MSIFARIVISGYMCTFNLEFSDDGQYLIAWTLTLYQGEIFAQVFSHLVTLVNFNRNKTNSVISIVTIRKYIITVITLPHKKLSKFYLESSKFTYSEFIYSEFIRNSFILNLFRIHLL